jgi:hypothetical protein
MKFAEDMPLEDRIKRDGDQWRYIYLLERALEAHRSRRIVMLASLVLNAALVAVLLWQVI